MDENRELNVNELEKANGGDGFGDGKGVSRKEGGKKTIDITPDIKCPNCGSDGFVPAELVFPFEKLRCKSCGEIFDVPEFDQSAFDDS